MANLFEKLKYPYFMAAITYENQLQQQQQKELQITQQKIELERQRIPQSLLIFS